MYIKPVMADSMRTTLFQSHVFTGVMQVPDALSSYLHGLNRQEYLAAAVKITYMGEKK